MSARDEVSACLETWSSEGDALNARGPNASSALFVNDSRRREVLQSIRDEYLSQQLDVSTDGALAVVTAGPPAAGKSTAVNGLGSGYRRIDADIIKDLLIRRALTAGTYDTLLALTLPDGRPLHPRELAGLVHEESTQIANGVMEIAAQRHENVVIEGTLGWWRHAQYLLEVFEARRYERLSIMSFEVPEAIAQERALERWWSGRERLADGLGGRFVPAVVVSGLYVKTVDHSDCRDNARDLFDCAIGAIPNVYLREEDLTGVTEKRHVM